MDNVTLIGIIIGIAGIVISVLLAIRAKSNSIKQNQKDSSNSTQTINIGEKKE